MSRTSMRMSFLCSSQCLAQSIVSEESFNFSRLCSPHLTHFVHSAGNSKHVDLQNSLLHKILFYEVKRLDYYVLNINT